MNRGGGRELQKWIARGGGGGRSCRNESRVGRGGSYGNGLPGGGRGDTEKPHPSKNGVGGSSG